MKTTVLIYYPDVAEKFREALLPLLPDVTVLAARTPAEAEPFIERADALFTWGFPAHLMAKAQRLRWIQAMGAGVDDVMALPLPENVMITRIEGLSGVTMSEYAFTYMLADAQHLSRFAANQAERRWEAVDPVRLHGRRLGVAGIGAIGREIARKGRAFGMEIWGLARTPRRDPEFDRTFGPAEAAAFIAGVDYLVSSLPHTPAAIGLIDPRQMKPGSLLINIGRGQTIAEDAILQAVQSGRIRAVLDVFATEPLPPEHPFWSTPGITITPHIAGPLLPEDVMPYCAANFRRWQAGEAMQGLVHRHRGY